MLQLPNELLRHISQQLDRDADINALVRTNRRFFITCNDILYHENVQHRNSTALSWAAINGNDQTARKALAAGATGLDEALCLSAKNGHRQVTESLLACRERHVFFWDEDDTTALHLAAENGHFDILELLLAVEGVLPDIRDGTFRTPLTTAAGKGHDAIVKLLLSTGKVNVNWADDLERSALFLAAGNGHENVVKTLLNVDGIEIDFLSNEDVTPLMVASQSGRESVVRLLLQAGADFNREDMYRVDAFGKAVEAGHQRIAELLVSVGRL